MQTDVFTQVSHKSEAEQNAYYTLIGNIYLQAQQREIKTIAITSCNPKEGKTSTAINLAISLASMGKKTLLVDLDLRKTYFKKSLEQPIEYDISEYLTDNLEVNEILFKTSIENLFFLSSSKVIGNPMALLCSEKLKLFIDGCRKIYDYIIFDTPSLDCIIDALIISAKVDATILVVQNGYTSIVDLKKAQDQFNRVGIDIMGVVLNKAKRRITKRKLRTKNNYFRVKKNSQLSP